MRIVRRQTGEELIAIAALFPKQRSAARAGGAENGRETAFAPGNIVLRGRLIA